MSRIGKQPVVIPDKVKVNIEGRKVLVEGPKGKLDFEHHERMKAEVKDSQIVVSRQGDSKFDRTLHGTTRARIQNLIIGVTEGYKKELEIIGVGFRAQVQGKKLNLQLGFSHPIDYAIPEGIIVEAPKPTQLIVNGIDKILVGQVASEIRAYYPPEPYKGKGVRYVGEYVVRKVGKKVA